MGDFVDQKNVQSVVVLGHNSDLDDPPLQVAVTGLSGRLVWSIATGWKKLARTALQCKPSLAFPTLVRKCAFIHCLASIGSVS